MTIAELVRQLPCAVLAGEDGLHNQIRGCHLGDLLSSVLARGREGDLWISVMGNQNAVAICTLKKLAALLLCQDSPADREALDAANAYGVPLLSSPLPAYRLALRLGQLLLETPPPAGEEGARA